MNANKRPLLDPSILHGEMKPIEYFQNKALRPILKMQHGLIILLFHQYLVDRRIELTGKTADNIRVIITNIISKDLALKNEMIGLIIGHLSRAEMEFYLLNKASSRRRITNMLVERILSEYSTSINII